MQEIDFQRVTANKPQTFGKQVVRIEEVRIILKYDPNVIDQDHPTHILQIPWHFTYDGNHPYPKKGHEQVFVLEVSGNQPFISPQQHSHIEIEVKSRYEVKGGCLDNRGEHIYVPRKIMQAQDQNDMNRPPRISRMVSMPSQGQHTTTICRTRRRQTNSLPYTNRQCSQPSSS